jgi:hypothetical protein
MASTRDVECRAEGHEGDGLGQYNALVPQIVDGGVVLPHTLSICRECYLRQYKDEYPDAEQPVL